MRSWSDCRKELKSLATDVCITTPSLGNFVVSAQQAQAKNLNPYGYASAFLKSKLAST
jgi:hypothetical protein